MPSGTARRATLTCSANRCLRLQCRGLAFEHPPRQGSSAERAGAGPASFAGTGCPGALLETHGYAAEVSVGSIPLTATDWPRDFGADLPTEIPSLTAYELAQVKTAGFDAAERHAAMLRLEAVEREVDPAWRVGEAAKWLAEAAPLCEQRPLDGEQFGELLAAMTSLRSAGEDVASEGTHWRRWFTLPRPGRGGGGRRRALRHQAGRWPGQRHARELPLERGAGCCRRASAGEPHACAGGCRLGHKTLKCRTRSRYTASFSGGGQRLRFLK